MLLQKRTILGCHLSHLQRHLERMILGKNDDDDFNKQTGSGGSRQFLSKCHVKYDSKASNKSM